MGVLTAAHADPGLTIEEAQERVDELYDQATAATERYNLATDEMADVERRLARAEKNVKRQQEQLNTLTADLGGFAAAAYRGGTIDPTLQAMLADDPDEYLARASVLDAYASQQANQLQLISGERDKLTQDSLLAEEELARFEAIEATLEAEADEIEQLMDDAERVLDGLEAEERQRLEAEQQAEIDRQREEAAEQASRSAEESSDEGGSDVPASERGQVAVDFAMAQIGDAYVWGGTGPDSWDCSGLTGAAWKAAGVSLPRSSGQQFGASPRVSFDNLRPGDLLFFYSPVGHVGMYIGNNQMVHASRPGVPVNVVTLDGHYTANFVGATRPG
jgi:cell wall-associated NlpC family hydrolase